MKVLLADDDPISLRIVSGYLQDWGYEVLEAKDGVRAYQILSSENVRLALLDWLMPGLQGVEICKRVRELENGAFYYLILLTARESGNDIKEGFAAGADDYITKPFQAPELRSRLRAGERIIKLQEELADKIKELSRVNRSLIQAYSDLKEVANRLEGESSFCNRGVIVIDGKGNLFGANLYARKILHFPLKKILKLNLQEIISPRDYERFLKGIKEAMIETSKLGDVTFKIGEEKKILKDLMITRLDLNQGVVFLLFFR